MSVQNVLGNFSALTGRIRDQPPRDGDLKRFQNAASVGWHSAPWGPDGRPILLAEDPERA